MRVPIFQVDAFAKRRFEGNPAAVMVLPGFPDDTMLQTIAAENNLAETAFLVPRSGHYDLRWFTPAVEVPLCGHATLASAAVVMERLEPDRKQVVFQNDKRSFGSRAQERSICHGFALQAVREGNTSGESGRRAQCRSGGGPW